jgi:hypothetical protein
MLQLQDDSSHAFVMTEQATAEHRIVLGDPVPWFSAPEIGGGSFDLHVSAGRCVVLSFLGSPADPRANVEPRGRRLRFSRVPLWRRRRENARGQQCQVACRREALFGRAGSAVSRMILPEPRLPERRRRKMKFKMSAVRNGKLPHASRWASGFCDRGRPRLGFN